MKPEDTIMALIKEMHAWEVWANQFTNLVNGDESNESFDEDEFFTECDARYYDILDRYAINRSVCKGISYGDPTGYDVNEKIISIEIDNDQATIRTVQSHRKRLTETDEDPNYEIVFKLMKLGSDWKVTERKSVDWAGEVFDVGI